MNLRQHLTEELGRRTARNPRYSRRAFARSLGLHHTTLARYLDGQRSLSRTLLSRVSARLGFAADTVQEVIAHEAARKVLDAAQDIAFRPDCRWIAIKTGLAIDDVNRALHLLIYDRRLQMASTTTWKVTES